MSEQRDALEALAKSLGYTVTFDESTKSEGTVVFKSESKEDKDEASKSAEETSKEVEEVAQGSVTESCAIYQGPKDTNNEFTWVDKAPDSATNAAENQNTAKYAVLIRNRKSTDSRKKFEIDSFVIQSPWLKKALGEVLKDYPGVYCDLERLTFDAPFQPFVHRWKQFVDFFNGEHDETTISHMKLLRAILEEELKDTLSTFQDHVTKGIVTFKDLWTVFQPGSLIYCTSSGGAPALVELQTGNYADDDLNQVFSLICKYVDFNGDYFGRNTQELKIFKYEGAHPITSLHAYPLSFHESKELVKKAMLERGKKFEGLSGFHYKQYNGYAFSRNSDREPVRLHVNGRIVIDAESWNRYSNFYPEKLEPLFPTNTKKSSQFYDYDDERHYENISAFWDAPRPDVQLEEKHLLTCSPRVKGYSMKSKKWVDFLVDTIEDIAWNDSVLDRLVLPENQKELVVSIIQSQVVNRDVFDDVIQSKGAGVIMMLSGSPGVGKTLTAEVLAESMHAPLYTVSAGELGAYPSDVEENLSRILDMVARWNAILLLDECDVFLETRDEQDLYRNKLVSIFLRVIEYYQSIMILTTNRLDNIDAAFKSRIHISMAYPDLDAPSRQAIWENFLVTTPNTLKPKDLKELSQIVLNGRQIKNAVKTASLLAARRKKQLGREHLDTVLLLEKTRPENEIMEIVKST